jgi:hypothetical protein
LICIVDSEQARMIPGFRLPDEDRLQTFLKFHRALKLVGWVTNRSLPCNSLQQASTVAASCLIFSAAPLADGACGRHTREYRTMKKVSSTAAIAALISVGATMPAYAGWTNIGRVDFADGVDKDTAYGNFGGPATALQLTARDSDVDCRFVRATFGNGNTATIFQGKLPQGRGVRIDLPGDKRNVTKLAFECRSFVRSGAHVDINADVGAYRQL